VNEAPGTGTDAALAGLGHAVARAARALEAVPGHDDLAAYRYVTGLDEALRPLDDLLRSASGLVELADAPAVGQRLTRLQAELGARCEEITAARMALASLRAVEQDLTETAAEAERIRHRVAQLEQAQRIAADLPALRGRLRDLEDAIPAASAMDSAEVAAGLGQAVERLSALTAQQREILGEQARDMIAQAENAARELSEQRSRRDAATADLAERAEQATQLQEELERMLPQLAAWRQADADLVDGLGQAGLDADASPLEAVRTELAELGDRMTALDTTLRQVLARHAQAYNEARRVRNLSGGSDAGHA
jgi:chromosome segregation ATPase